MTMSGSWLIWSKQEASVLLKVSEDIIVLEIVMAIMKFVSDPLLHFRVTLYAFLRWYFRHHL
jgi:hypothetical protein